MFNRLFTHHTVPARTLEAIVFILSMSLVNTDAAKPYMVLLALSISSFMSLNFMICITGPKIYYRKKKRAISVKDICPPAVNFNLGWGKLSFIGKRLVSGRRRKKELARHNSLVSRFKFRQQESNSYSQVSCHLKVSTRRHAEVTEVIGTRAFKTKSIVILFERPFPRPPLPCGHDNRHLRLALATKRP